MADVRPQRQTGYQPRPRVTQDINQVVEPNWRELIADGIDKTNIRARKAARSHWSCIIVSLRQNGTLTVVSLELVKRLVIERVRFDMACSEYFREGMEVFDDRLERKRLNYAGEEMDRAQRAAITYERMLGLTPKNKGKLRKIEPNVLVGSAAYLRPVR